MADKADKGHAAAATALAGTHAADQASEMLRFPIFRDHTR